MQKPRIGIHQIIAEFFEAIGEKEAGDKRAGIQVVADFLGKGRSTVYKWTDPDQEGEVSFKDIGRLAEHYRIPLVAEHLANRTGGVFVQLEASPATEARYMRTICDFGGGLQQVISDLTTAVADNGKIDQREVAALKMREHLARIITDLVAHDLHLRDIAEEAEADRVVPMKSAAR